MTDLHDRVARIGHDALSAFRSALGIASPSRAFADLRWDKLTLDGQPWPPVAPLPWYAARAPLDAYESPELRAAARRVRRLIRRHWFALFFEPESDIAHEIRIALAKRPRVPGESTLFDEVLLLQKQGFAPKDGGELRELFANCGIPLEVSS